MSFRIAPFPGQTYPSKYANNEDIRAWLGHGELVERRLNFGHGPETYKTVIAKKLPADFCASSVAVPLTDGRFTTIQCAPGHTSTIGLRGKSSKHRVTAQCPDCGKWVPAGRAHQHQCKLEGSWGPGGEG